DVLALDMTESESRQRALVSDPTPPSKPPALPDPGAVARPPAEIALPAAMPAPPADPPAAATSTCESDADASQAGTACPAPAGDLLAEHIVSPAPTTERLQSIQRMLADQLG